MRDVTKSFDKSDMVSILKSLFTFLKNPIAEIGNIPTWSMTLILVIQVAIALGSGFLASLINFSVHHDFLIAVIFLRPIFAIFLNILMSLFLYYFFQIFEHKTVSFQKLSTNVLFAFLPFFVFLIASEIFKPIILLGFAIAALVLVVGLTENFSLERKKALRLMGIIYATVLASYLWYKLDLRHIETASLNSQTTPTK